MANKFSKVYATDIYDGKEWKNFAPTDFIEDPKKYAPIPYREEALEVLKMDGTRLDFEDDSFDIAFSFSSIEHFGGDHHFGALKSLKAMERVLKTNGIAVISTEYIINNKEHHEFFNQRTIYTDLIDKLIELRPVEPLNLSLTKNSLNSVIDYDSAVMWDTTEEINDFKLNHPLILMILNDILLTSVMLVFQKK